MGKNVVTPEQKKDAERLKAIYSQKAKALGLTQEKLGIALGGSGQSTAGNYLNGITALNLKAAIIFSRQLRVPIADFSPRIAEQLDSEPKSASLDSVIDMMQGFSLVEIMATMDEAQMLIKRKVESVTAQDESLQSKKIVEG